MVFSVLVAMSTWLIVVSAAKGLPISTTQCIVGSVLGVVLVGPLVGEGDWGVGAMNWWVVAQIVAGWIVSPLIGFFISALVSALVRRLRRRAGGLIAYEKQDRIASVALLTFLILTSFSRGGNDVANAVAPLFAVQELADTSHIPLALGGIGMAIGMMTVGRRVIRTVATEIVTLSPTSALSASVSVSLVMLTGTLLGLPLSGTHVLLAALIAVGWIERTSVRKEQVRNIVISWLITVPLSGLLASVVLAVVNTAL
jgi:PiT family inorganic phosphate transporter